MDGTAPRAEDDAQSTLRVPEAEWSLRVAECWERKQREPGVSFVLTDSEGNTWRV